MKIQEIAIGTIRIPLVTPFRTALRTVDSINDLIVKITADDGSVGFGEAPPTAVITGDTKESIEAAIRGYLAPAVVGMELQNLDEIMRRMEKAIAKNTSAKAAMDIALYDLYAKMLGKPLYRVLAKEAAGRSIDTCTSVNKMDDLTNPAEKVLEQENVSCTSAELETDITISVDETEKMVSDSLRAVADGFGILKVKVGKGGEKDVERVRAIRQAVGPDVILRVDANQGWTKEEEIATIRAMEDAGLGIELVEQPVSYHDFHGLQSVTKAVNTPILADESVFSYEDAQRIIEEHAADLINIKLMKTGGIHQALRICDLADRYQVKCMVGCMLESKVSVSAGVHLAAARSCITMADLDGPSLCAEDPYEGGPVYRGPKIFLNEESGIGITRVPVEFACVARA